MKSSFIDWKAPDGPLVPEPDVRPEVGSVDDPEVVPVEEPEA